MRKAVVLTFCVLLALSCAEGNKGLERAFARTWHAWTRPWETANS